MLAVEEEVAALFVVGAAREVETCAALVLDGVFDGRAGFEPDLPRTGDVLRQCPAATVEFLTSS